MDHLSLGGAAILADVAMTFLRLQTFSFNRGALVRSTPSSSQKTIRRVVVDHPHGLHERIDNRASNEPEPPLSQVFRERIALARTRRNLRGASPPVGERLASHKLPDVGIKRAEGMLDCEECLCVRHGGVDLQAVSDDPLVPKQGRFLCPVKGSDLDGIESGKDMTITLSPP
jgi:hypothetical protein